MNTLESFYQDLEELLPFIGKRVIDDESPEGTSKVESWNSHSMEFTLSNSLGTKKIVWYKLEPMVYKTIKSNCK